jgi:hypothetical protein
VDRLESFVILFGVIYYEAIEMFYLILSVSSYYEATRSLNFSVVDFLVSVFGKPFFQIVYS